MSLDARLAAAGLVVRFDSARFPEIGPPLLVPPQVHVASGRLTLVHASRGAEVFRGRVDGLDFAAWEANRYTFGTKWSSGDFNMDGIADLAIGSPHGNPQGRISAGVVHVLIGQTKGWPDVIDLARIDIEESGVDAVAIIDGASGSATSDAGDTLCYSAAAADLDGDGHTDLIVNEMAGNGLAEGTVDVGNMLLISGAALSDFPVDQAE